MKKAISLILITVMCFAAGACRKDDRKVETTRPEYTVTEREEHLVNSEKQLHKVTVTETDRAFAVNGRSDYVIVRTDSVKELAASSFLQRMIAEATGATLSAVLPDEASYSADAKLIVMGDETMFAAAGLTMPQDDLGNTGYYIKSVGDSVFIMSKGFGYQYAVLAFLRAVLGYEMYAADTVTFSKSGETLPDLEIIEKPDFDYIIASMPMESDAQYGMGFLSLGDLPMYVQGQFSHNSLYYLPKKTFQSAHPGWYSDAGSQLCYSAHGDGDEKALMVREVADVILAAAEKYPDRNLIEFTQMDGGAYCSCESCKKISDKYGTTAAVQIQFINEVRALLDSELPAGRNVEVVFFAYNDTQTPPARKNEVTGEWEPVDDTVVLADGVSVKIAPAYSNFYHSFQEEQNADIVANIDGWKACAKSIHFYLYETNYHYYMYPFNTYDSMIETYRVCKEANAVYMYSQGQSGQNNGASHFTKFKEYLNSKAMFDVNSDYNTLVDNFFENYFGAAKEPMKELFESIQIWMRYLEDAYPTIATGFMYDEIEQARLWPKRTLDGYMRLIDEAYAAIEPIRAENSALYETLRDHITLESLFPRYALIQLHTAYYASDDLQNMRLSFKEDATRLGVSRYREGGNMRNVYISWGIE